MSRQPDGPLDTESRTPRSRQPNVVVVLFDDLGFAQLGCFGADFDTPHVDRLAAGGLRYNRFHVTSICSASRASLLTGRNHHAVGVGSLVMDCIQDFPGYTGRIPKSAGTLPRLLSDAGYSTFAVGKWHLTPPSELSHAGPFDRWPLGLGFERYYGIIEGEANQWTPVLTCDNHHVEPPRRADEGYHLTEDLADKAIRMVMDQQHAAPDKPFFLYFAPGAMHSPHHVGSDWVDPYRGRFDLGWDRWRTEVFERQVGSGVVPPGTVLTERPPWVQPWNTLSADEQRMFARMHEVYGAFLSHADAQIGRLLAALEMLGQLENTIVLVTSDNGASGEGGPLGSYSEHRTWQRIPVTLEANLDHFDDWGGTRGSYHYPWGWAWAGNTPLRLWKRYTWLGGTRVPLVVHWPAAIRAEGEIRSQIVHISDVMPTILEAAGVDPPDVLDGVPQQRIDGASFAETFNEPTATTPRHVQYFEMLGSRAIIFGEWKATTNHVERMIEAEEQLLKGSRSFDDDRWSLSRLDTDFSEAHDVAAKHPEIVTMLDRLWWSEAARNNVLPLFESIFEIIDRDKPARTTAVFRPGGSPVIAESLPDLSRGGRVTALVDIPPEGAEGILCALGDWTTGFAMYIVDDHLLFALNAAGDLFRVSATQALPPGRREVSCTLTRTRGRNAILALSYDGVEVGSAPARLPTIWHFGIAGLNLGRDRGFPVCDDYEPPFAWTGVLHEVRVESATPGAAAAVGRARIALHAD